MASTRPLLFSITTTVPCTTGRTRSSARAAVLPLPSATCHSPRGTPTDFFWSLHWVIPADYPTGSLVYKVVATDLDGRTQTWEPFKRAPTQLTVIAGEPAMKHP